MTWLKYQLVSFWVRAASVLRVVLGSLSCRTWKLAKTCHARDRTYSNPPKKVKIRHALTHQLRKDAFIHLHWLLCNQCHMTYELWWLLFVWQLAKYVHCQPRVSGRWKLTWCSTIQHRFKMQDYVNRPLQSAQSHCNASKPSWHVTRE